eukprot:gb/GECG01001722.1/.p1 GENE.gb/GECG01001722.1/~~gb/GECG01001722.1/.p1  ORF type:complete len:123 (+),score=17.13 gb/GECG01001722.1/:1-369(+)
MNGDRVTEEAFVSSMTMEKWKWEWQWITHNLTLMTSMASVISMEGPNRDGGGLKYEVSMKVEEKFDWSSSPKTCTVKWTRMDRNEVVHEYTDGELKNGHPIKKIARTPHNAEKWKTGRDMLM